MRTPPKKSILVILIALFITIDPNQIALAQSAFAMQDVTKSCDFGVGFFREVDGASQQEWPSLSSWDPTIKHDDEDQDIYVKGVCEISSNCVWKGRPATGYIKEEDSCAGSTAVTQFQTNAYSYREFSNGQEQIFLICSSWTVPCANGCNDGACIPPDITIKASGDYHSAGTFRATCGSNSQTIQTTAGASATVDCKDGEPLSLSCDMSGTNGDRVVSSIKKTTSSPSTTVKYCGNNKDCSYSVTLGAPHQEYTCHVVK